MNAPVLEIRPEAPDSPEGRACLEAYYAELAARFEGGFRIDPCDLASDARMAPPSGLFLVARLAGRPAGCGGLKLVGADIGEIKRVWTDPSARRSGVGRAVLAALEGHARAMGARAVRLDTNRALHEARAMYGRLGYAEVAPFNDHACAHHWFAKPL